ncbi:MAG: hypothetical protein IPN50_04675 [Sphingomonadales bacterium]|uniref:hypothetical protein n=2 Tax=Sphingorhabdus sp. TaxID=1902408 RepID=UPI003BB01622|nr:hypothetical protein [Sphingomonadales bacterium]MBK9431727.1 hypothetical protein [Sphingomonadales bacterium]MBL0023441.1 hypothetical protein [Sphingomonadales bacterium]
MIRWLAACCGLLMLATSASGTPPVWTATTSAALADDDLARHSQDPAYLDGLALTSLSFSENGFAWQLLRFDNLAKPDGPLWVVPHDDENAAFEAVIAALRLHGGRAIVVNSSGSLRRQSGSGRCGVRSGIVSACDPNRNFAADAPLFTAAFLDQIVPGQPIIALHTNGHGFSGDGKGGRGDITILDASAFGNGRIKPRVWGHFGNGSNTKLVDYDTLGLVAWLASNGTPDAKAVACRIALNQSGVHFWHERVVRSDGSLSNYLALYRPEIDYFNAEARADSDLSIAAEKHALMVDAYLKNC